ncbi:MAG TPA: RecQ family ATP-dependent DNA helicase [Chryseosolibacter sp.]
MDPIAFIDSEIEYEKNRILDLGGIKQDDSRYHSKSPRGFIDFLKGARWICGHNILKHDLKYLGQAIKDAGIAENRIIDTLYLSPLLFPKKPYHALVKDEKLQYDELNNPLNDSIKARDLFYDEVSAFNQLEESLRVIFYLLLKSRPEFNPFFDFIGFTAAHDNLPVLILDTFKDKICYRASLDSLVSEKPVELAYTLALVNCDDRYSIAPRWVERNFPLVDQVMHALRGTPCLTGCDYCHEALNPYKGLKRFFGFDNFRTYDGQPLQEQAVKAALDNKSLLAIFPTGGGKSITFQLPALMSGESTKGLTVVISPLQSLMKDQVDNLLKADVPGAVTINGLLDPIERAESINQVANGSASLLYIAPESLRSVTIGNLLLGRKVVRFVIDEAHCFSAWGHDFRVDYLYIADFIKSIQKRKNLEEPIPISCFTATAKQNVIDDIRRYFKERLNLDLEVFRTSASRTNLRYQVFEEATDEEKYRKLRDLILEKQCPTIVYVSRTYRADKLTKQLGNDGFNVRAFHGKMDIADKTANQEAFIAGRVQIMVATSAFGMGVDKKNIGLVVHYEISDSLENYIQEAGRAGRDETMSADCFVLFNEEDLGKHFILLNQTKLSIKEIQQVWKAIKDITKYRMSASNSALEIARKAGWDDNILQIETRVTTAIAALEEAGYLKRGQNAPRIFANSILARTAQEAIDKINASTSFDDRKKEKAIRIIKKLFSSKHRKPSADEVAESRVDYISDHLGIVKDEVLKIISLLREEKILGDQKDLAAFINKGENQNKSLQVLEMYSQIERFLLPLLDEDGKMFNIKELNEQLESGCREANPNRIKTIINFWVTKNWVKRQNQDYSKNHFVLALLSGKEKLKARLQSRYELARFIVSYLFEKSAQNTSGAQDLHLVEFSVHELKEQYEKSTTLFQKSVSVDDIEDALFYLSRVEAIKIEGGFLVTYNGLTINRLEQNNKVQYRKEHYQKLDNFYTHKIQQIHVVGEYAKKMISDYKGALQFVDDYFQLNYSSFLNRYFPGSREKEIRRNITPAKFRKLFGTLSPAQLEIIRDNQSQYIVVAAGPGSGKTRVLVHKLASLILMEDVKYEQLLMLTFSRAAATEFKKRLIELIGGAAHFVEMKTFHSYCFDLLGRVGTLKKSDVILQETVSRINDGEVEPSRITKAVLVIDEAQDMDADEFALINALIGQNEGMRVIAVGDDDQNIFGFRGADAKYMQLLIPEREARKYELVENYRSGQALIEFSNRFATRLRHRLKTNPIMPRRPQTGTIKIVQYKSRNLVTPIVHDIVNTGLAGTTCVLTRTNEEAALVTGSLLRRGYHAKLIQSNEGFNLYNLLEVRYLFEQLGAESSGIIIAEESWKQAKRRLVDRFRSSRNLELVTNIIADFEQSSANRKYRSDLELFVKESNLEDFYRQEADTILVSTIHKAKGREFDNVFLLLDDARMEKDDDIRALYVAITRAKDNLTIHTNGSQFDGIKVEGLLRAFDNGTHGLPRELVVQLSLRDVVLDYFMYKQPLYRDLVAGNDLQVRPDGCCNAKGEYLLKFSARCKELVAEKQRSGYALTRAAVNFVVYWQKEGEGPEYRTVLPELWFEGGG